MYQLTERAGRNRGMSWTLSDAPFVIGRDEGCGIRVEDHIVSRRHCELRQEQGRVYVRDLDSSNGTFVNDEPVREVALEAGDEIRLGTHVFVLTQDEPEPTQASEAAAEKDVAITVDLSEAYYVRETLTQAPTTNVPRRLQDFRDLLAISRRFNGASTVAALLEVLAEILRERFQPDSFWLVRHALPVWRTLSWR